MHRLHFLPGDPFQPSPPASLSLRNSATAAKTSRCVSKWWTLQGRRREGQCRCSKRRWARDSACKLRLSVAFTGKLAIIFLPYFGYFFLSYSAFLFWPHNCPQFGGWGVPGSQFSFPSCKALVSSFSFSAGARSSHACRTVTALELERCDV